MTFRIHEHVLRGEICHTDSNHVSGWLDMLMTTGNSGPATARPTRVFLSLTGNLTGQLTGRRFRFQVRERDVPVPAPLHADSFSLQQIGAMGVSRLRMVRVPLMPIEEFYLARRLGDDPPEDLQPLLHLEWYSQNGRVTLELVDPELEFDGSDPQLPDPQPEPLPEFPPGGPEIIRIEDAGDGGITSLILRPDDDSLDDPFRLFPRDFESDLSASVRQVADDSSSLEADDTSVDHQRESESRPGDPDAWQQIIADATETSETVGGGRPLADWAEVLPGIDAETRALYEEWDEIAFGTRDEPLTWLFECPLHLPQPDSLTDEDHAW